MRSASYRARLNRRSTTRCIRRRSGLNSAAATSVDAATATGVLSDTTCVASSTIPAYTPTSRPVTIAYASVRETIRSMSNSRYLMTATLTLSGSASNPTGRMAPATCAAPEVLSDSVKMIPMQMPLTADPASSHFSCWRRIPDERR